MKGEKGADAKIEWNKAVTLDPDALTKSSGVSLAVAGTPLMKY
jgi:hypothetical protein